MPLVDLDIFYSNETVSPSPQSVFVGSKSLMVILKRDPSGIIIYMSKLWAPP